MSKKATITLVDEINCFISGLDLRTKGVIRKEYSYFKEGYFHSPKYQIGIWDGKKYLFNDGWFYNNLIDEGFLDLLSSRNYEVDIVDKRVKNPVELAPVTKEEFVFKKGDTVITLRDYQIDAVNKALSNHSGMFLMGTGSGKTYTCAAIATRFLSKGKVIVIVPTTDLVFQTAKSFDEMGLDCGRFCGDIKEPKDVTVTTWQSLNNYRELFGDVVCLICDEAHGAKADVLFDMISESASNIVHRYGFTGTIPKDTLSQVLLRCSLGEIIFEKTTKELQDEGHLSECFINIIQIKEPPEKIFKDFQDEYQYLTKDKSRTAFMTNMVSDLSKTGNTAVIMKNIKPAEALVEELGEAAILITGKMKANKRKEYYSMMGKDTNHIFVCTDKVFATGIDIPDLHNLVFFEIGKSFTTTIQAVGRVLRLAEGKEMANLYDVCSTTKYSMKHLRERKKYYKEAGYPFAIRKVEKTRVNFK